MSLGGYLVYQVGLLTLPDPYTIQDVSHSNYAVKNELDNFPSIEGLRRAEFHARTVLVPMQELFGVDKIPLNSWNRNPAVNRGVGGSKTSNHMEGGATDVNHWALGMSSRGMFERIARSRIQFHTLICYHPDTVGSLHIDSQPGSNRRKLQYRHADGVYRSTPWW
ncbi:MAG: hypothetical protein KDA24_24675 [Deltaproteobacteria bacterium]|nr:hypothetical protein [Deltaproteobacteria bacterium]